MASRFTKLLSDFTEYGLCAVSYTHLDVYKRQVKKSGDKIDVKKLSEELGCPIIETSALKGTGLDEVIRTASNVTQTVKVQPIVHKFSGDVEQTLEGIEALISGVVEPANLRWYAIKLFERCLLYTSRCV